MPNPALPACLSTPAHPGPRPGRPAPLVFAGFDCVSADPSFAANEQKQRCYPGDAGQIDYIPAEGTLPIVDLPAKMVQLVQHCWQVASVSAGDRRGWAQAGGARVAPYADRMKQLEASRAPADIIEPARQKEAHSYVKQVAPLSESKEIARDWKLSKGFTRVNAYTFRGEHGLGPKDIEAAGGFHPPITRNDRRYVDEVIFPQFQTYMKRRFGIELTKERFERAYNQEIVFPQDRTLIINYFSWRALVEIESHHLGRMFVKEDLKNYISTTKYVPMAKNFAGRGWVYVTRVRGGFDTNSTTSWSSQLTHAEQEIAFPGSLLWDDVFGFRQLNQDSYFTGPLYLRRTLRGNNPAAYKEVFELMSGKRQS